jgi:hypothetical protein
MHSIVLYSILSIAIPLAGYGFFFLTGAVPAGLPEPRVYFPLVVSNVLGLSLAVIALSRSNPRPMDISARMRLILLLGTLGLLANIIAAEYLLAVAVLPVPIPDAV